MKRNFVLKLSQLVFIAAVMMFGIHQSVQSGEVRRIVYRLSYQDFPNPERGFFVSFNPYGNNPRPALELEQLTELRSRNITLARRYYLIDRFRNQPFDSEFLDLVASDLATAREAGVKLIVRFTYNWLGGGEDASEARILAHIQQLEPVLRDNYDVLAYMEAGFIGYWGEWNNSTNGLRDNPQAKKAIIEQLLTVLPPERMVALRYTHYKREILNDNTPLNKKTAFTGSTKGRIAAHNDCFLASIDDKGTYNSTNPDKIAAQKAYLHQDNLYVVQGGELCKRNPPRTDCDLAMAELKQMRWSTLNYYASEHKLNSIFQDWQEQGCLGTIRRSLGYRFRLVQSRLKLSKLTKGTVDLQLTIKNQGWASLYNPRPLEIILRHQSTGTEYYLKTDEDPRFWQPGSFKKLHIQGNLPANMPRGKYQILLNLPDAHSQLSRRPQYSIRLANSNIWEEATGYNNLQQNIMISPSYAAKKANAATFRLRE